MRCAGARARLARGPADGNWRVVPLMARATRVPPRAVTLMRRVPSHLSLCLCTAVRFARTYGRKFGSTAREGNSLVLGSWGSPAPLHLAGRRLQCDHELRSRNQRATPSAAVVHPQRHVSRDAAARRSSWDARAHVLDALGYKTPQKHPVRVPVQRGSSRRPR